MADYTTITDAQVDPEAPITSELMSALRDNPIAIAEAATGAPKIDPKALDTYLLGPLGNSFPQYSYGGTTVLGTVTDLDGCYFLFCSGTVTCTNPGNSILRVDRSSNNGSSWGNSLTVASVSDDTSGDGTETNFGSLIVPMYGFNAIRLVHQSTLTIFAASGVGSAMLVAGTF